VIPTITATQLNQQHGHAQLIDVRSPSEFAAGHIPQAINIPMDQIEARLADLQPDVPLILVCQKGQRAEMTARLLAPCEREIAVLRGGTNAWIECGFPLVTNTKTRWSLERQVRFGAGFLVSAGILLSRLASPAWLFLAAFVGLGLMFAGLTDLCPMAIALRYMPWNRRTHCARTSSSVELARTGQ
jgi:rhodanese-related sulfurtransferase